MKGALHITPVLFLPEPGIWADSVELTVEASHRVLAPYRPFIRRAVAGDAYAIAGLNDSIFGWTVDLGFDRSDRPLTFQFNWTVMVDDHRRQCQHRLTLHLQNARTLAAPLWSTDATLWPDDRAARLTPFSVFDPSQLTDDIQRDLTMTARPHVTTIQETLNVPAIERDELSSKMGERYDVTQKAAA